jgi:hypothetical protein
MNDTRTSANLPPVPADLLSVLPDNNGTSQRMLLGQRIAGSPKNGKGTASYTPYGAFFLLCGQLSLIRRSVAQRQLCGSCIFESPLAIGRAFRRVLLTM